MLIEPLIDVDLKILSTPKIIKFGATASPCQIQQLTALCCEFSDIFAWEYSNMKGIDPDIVSHNITITLGEKPIRQHQHPVNPKILTSVKLKVEKLICVGFITPIDYP